VTQVLRVACSACDVADPWLTMCGMYIMSQIGLTRAGVPCSICQLIFVKKNERIACGMEFRCKRRNSLKTHVQLNAS
jgi:hypothetical protein